jgi:hypothetical protein
MDEELAALKEEVDQAFAVADANGTFDRFLREAFPERFTPDGTRLPVPASACPGVMSAAENVSGGVDTRFALGELSLP